MDLGLSGKTALILGAGGGLGGAIAKTLAAEGARVALADINVEAAKANADVISATGARAIALGWDLGDLGIIEPRIAEIENSLGQIDVLVSLTGGPPPGPIAGQSTALWEAQFNAMILSVIAITDRVLPNMRAKGWGRIITSATSGVVAPIPNLGLSNALRSALVGWSKTLASEVASDGITANIVLPGRIATPRIAFLDTKKSEREGRSVAEVEAESLRAIPAGRYGDPQEYADVVTFLASTRASYVTGSMIRIDGGYLSNV
jgi:3-oxoacyl-[acyl-carrier protein] reductase